MSRSRKYIFTIIIRRPNVDTRYLVFYNDNLVTHFSVYLSDFKRNNRLMFDSYHLYTLPEVYTSLLRELKLKHKNETYTIKIIPIRANIVYTLDKVFDVKEIYEYEEINAMAY